MPIFIHKIHKKLLKDKEMKLQSQPSGLTVFLFGVMWHRLMESFSQVYFFDVLNTKTQVAGLHILPATVYTNCVYSGCAACVYIHTLANSFKVMDHVRSYHVLDWQCCIPYSRLFWRALKLANWSKNIIGEF